MVGEPLLNLVDMLDMSLFIRGEDKDIIKINKNKLVKILSGNIVHQIAFKHRWRICKTKKKRKKSFLPTKKNSAPAGKRTDE